MRTLHLLYAGEYDDRTTVGVYPTRAAAEAEIVRTVLDGRADRLAGAEIVEVPLDGDEPTLAADALVALWAGVHPDVRDAVDEQCGGLVPLLDRLVAALPDVARAAEVRTALGVTR